MKKTLSILAGIFAFSLAFAVQARADLDGQTITGAKAIYEFTSVAHEEFALPFCVAAYIRRSDDAGLRPALGIYIHSISFRKTYVKSETQPPMPAMGVTLRFKTPAGEDLDQTEEFYCPLK